MSQHKEREREQAQKRTEVLSAEEARSWFIDSQGVKRRLYCANSDQEWAQGARIDYRVLAAERFMQQMCRTVLVKEMSAADIAGKAF